MYDRSLIEYLPGVLRTVREYKALTSAEDPEFALHWSNVQSALDDQFVLNASENGVKRWESILKITPKATLTLDERKFTILARLAEQLPYTIRMLLRMLNELCGPDGFKLGIYTGDYTLAVKIALTAVNNIADVGMLLRRVCPANLAISITIMYNTHTVISRFTHAQLSAYTHDRLRNEVFN